MAWYMIQYDKLQCNMIQYNVWYSMIQSDYWSIGPAYTSEGWNLISFDEMYASHSGEQSMQLFPWVCVVSYISRDSKGCIAPTVIPYHLFFYQLAHFHSIHTATTDGILTSNSARSEHTVPPSALPNRRDPGVPGVHQVEPRLWHLWGYPWHTSCILFA